MRLRPASKYSGCRLSQERQGSAILDKKGETDGVSPAIADLQTPADPSPRSGRGGPPGPSKQSPAPASTGPAVPPARKPKQAQPTGAAVLLSCAETARRPRRLTARRPREPPGSGREDRGCGGEERAGLPAASPRPAAWAADPRHPAPRAASPPPRRAAGWT